MATPKGPNDLAVYIDLAIEAMAAEDLTALRKNVAIAKLIFAQMPQTSADGTSISYQNQIQMLDSAVADLNSSMNGGIVSQSVEFQTW